VTNVYEFTNEEWEMLTVAPVIVGLAVARAENSGLIGSFRESRAAVAALTPDVDGNPAAHLIEAAAAVDSIESVERLTGGEAATPESLAELAVGVCEAASAALRAKATPEEVDGFNSWLLGVADRVANAAKEGGVRLSPPEEALIERLSTVLAPP
jgi:hypothetical protein